jgi:cell division protein FtsB
MAKKKAPEKTIRTEYHILDSESRSSKEIRRAQEERRKRRVVESQKNAETKERRRKARRRRRLAVGVFVIVGLMVIYSVGSSVVNMVELQKERAETEARLAQLQRQKGTLEEELKQVNTDEYVEQQARSELKMVKPGEILYLLTGEGASEYMEHEEEP